MNEIINLRKETINNLKKIKETITNDNTENFNRVINTLKEHIEKRKNIDYRCDSDEDGINFVFMDVMMEIIISMNKSRYIQNNKVIADKKDIIEIIDSTTKVLMQTKGIN